jgi:hypothetical protein
MQSMTKKQTVKLLICILTSLMLFIFLVRFLLFFQDGPNINSDLVLENKHYYIIADKGCWFLHGDPPTTGGFSVLPIGSSKVDLKVFENKRVRIRAKIRRTYGTVLCSTTPEVLRGASIVVDVFAVAIVE